MEQPVAPPQPPKLRQPRFVRGRPPTFPGRQVNDARPPANMRVRPQATHENLPTMEIHGLASWILLKSFLDDYTENNATKFSVEEMVDLEEINRCYVSATNENGQVWEKRIDDFSVDWLPFLGYVDGLARHNIPNFDNRAEGWHPHLRRLMDVAVDPNVLANDDEFEEFFSALGESLGDRSYIFNNNTKSYISSIDAYFLAISMKLLQSPRAGLVASLNNRTNLKAYVERVHQQSISRPVIDFSENLANSNFPADTPVNSSARLLSEVKVLQSETPLIGVGGFGYVFSCHVKENNLLEVQPGEYALKFFKKETMNDDPELNLASTLQHERFPRFFARGRNQSISCTVLELASGGDLARFIGERQRAGVPAIREDNMAFTISILKDVIYGLHIMRTSSSQPLVHGDLWARNILISDAANGRAKISDFGIVCIDGTYVDQPGRPGSTGKDDPCFINSGLRQKENDVFTFGKIAMALLCYHIDPHGMHAIEMYNTQRATVLERLMAIWGMPEDRAHLLVQLPLRCTGDNKDERPPPLEILGVLNSLIIEDE